MLCHVVIGSDVSKEIIAFVFEDQWVRTHLLLKIKAVVSSETSGFLYPFMQGHIPEELKPQLYLCEKIHKSHTLYNLWNPKFTVGLYKFEIYHKIQSRVIVLCDIKIRPVSHINWTEFPVARYYSVYVTVQVKVKVILEPVTKAQRGSRAIALLFP
jgi:hypothetical protein